MFDSLSLPVLLLIFAAAAAAVWVAGVYLSDATDILSSRWGLGEALGGLILLAVVTNLPEIAITVSGALHHDLSIAVGNLLGGIAVQTLVLVALDIWGVGKPAPLTFRAASLSLVLEGVLVLALLTLVVMGAQLPDTLVFARVPPAGLLIAVRVGGGIVAHRQVAPRSALAGQGQRARRAGRPARPEREEKGAGRQEQAKEHPARGGCFCRRCPGDTGLRRGAGEQRRRDCQAHRHDGRALRRDGAGGFHLAAGTFHRTGLAQAGRLPTGGQRHLRRQRLSDRALSAGRGDLGPARAAARAEERHLPDGSGHAS